MKLRILRGLRMTRAHTGPGDLRDAALRDLTHDPTRDHKLILQQVHHGNFIRPIVSAAHLNFSAPPFVRALAAKLRTDGSALAVREWPTGGRIRSSTVPASILSSVLRIAPGILISVSQNIDIVFTQAQIN